MASRASDPRDDEFDLTSFLWGDLPLIGEPPQAVGAQQPSDPPSAPRTSVGPVEDRLVAESSVLRETSPTWGTVSHQKEPLAPITTELDAGGDPSDAEDEFAAASDIDLEALAALANMADAGFAADDPASETLDGELAELVLDERPLSYGELTHRLHKEIMPHLRSLAANHGYLTLGYLARAVVDLQDSDVHLNQVRAFVDQIEAPLLPSRSHRGVRRLPIWAIRKAQRRFGDLLRDQIDEHVVIERFGYTGVPLTQGTRAFLVQAWMCHCLSRGEERALANIIAAEVARVGDESEAWSTDALAAREELILDNLWLVARMARRYMGRGVEIDDLLQFGAMGLFRAVERFDPELGYRFVTYASNWVFQSITRHIAEQSRVIRLPVHVHDRGKAIFAAMSELEQALEREPTLAEIAEASDTSESIVRALLVTSRPCSLDNPRVQREVGLLASSDDPTQVIEANVLGEAIQEAFASLTEPQRNVLELRFGLLDGGVRTLEEVGRARGVTRERIRQIESKAFERLRHPSRAKVLREFLSTPRPAASLRPIAPLPIPAAVAEALLHRFDTTDQAIIRYLWGLGGLKQRSVLATAERLQLPAEHVRKVSARIVALGSTRADRLANTKTRATRHNSIDTARLSVTTDAHPGWMLGAGDKTSADWANRIFGISHVAPLDRSPRLPNRPTHDAPVMQAPAAAAGASQQLADPAPSDPPLPASREVRIAEALEPESDAPPLEALSAEGWQAIAQAARRITDRDLRAVAEARAGFNGWGDLSQERTMGRLGVTRTYVKRAEQELLDALHDPDIRRALLHRWATIEGQVAADVRTNIPTNLDDVGADADEAAVAAPAEPSVSAVGAVLENDSDPGGANDLTIDVERLRGILPELPRGERQIASTLWALNGGRRRTIAEVARLFKLPESEIEGLSRRLLTRCSDTAVAANSHPHGRQFMHEAPTNERPLRQEIGGAPPPQTSLLNRFRRGIQRVRQHVAD